MNQGTKLKYDKFCVEYVIHGNGAKAAIAAGYAANSARSMANQLLTKPYISDKIKKLSSEIKTETRKTLSDIAKRREEIAFGKTTELFKDKWTNIKEPSELTQNQASMVSGVSITTGKYGTDITIKTHSQLEALRDLEKMINPEIKDSQKLQLEIHNHSDSTISTKEL